MTTHSIPVEQYILGFEGEIRARLIQIRELIKLIVPETEEGFSYGMPSYRYKDRVLVYFSAFKNHIGFYALPSGHSEFYKELSRYKQGKGSVQFPHDQELPLGLIRQIVEFRKWENDQAAELKSAAKRKKKDSAI